MASRSGRQCSVCHHRRHRHSGDVHAQYREGADHGSDVKLNPTPLGYTVSLLIYLVPVLALYWWFSRRCPEGDGALRRNSRVVLGRLLAPPREYRLDYRRSAYRWTLLTLIPLGFLLDIVFGYAFLTFNNRAATLTSIPLFPAFDFTKGQLVPHIPVEEFVFYTSASWRFCPYTSGAMRYWLDSYNVPDYEVPPSGTRGLPPYIAQVQIRTPLLISIALVSAAFVYKRLLAPPFAHEGFPRISRFSSSRRCSQPSCCSGPRNGSSTGGP